MPAVMLAVHDVAGACRRLALLFLSIGLVHAQQALQSAWPPLQQVRFGGACVRLAWPVVRSDQCVDEHVGGPCIGTSYHLRVRPGPAPGLS